MSSTKYSIILPTYNERQNVAICIYLIDWYMQSGNVDYEVIVVDDNSPDGTQEVVKQLQQVFGSAHVKLAARAGKLGLGTAYVHGLTFVEGDFVILMDADLSHHPKYIPGMIERQRTTGCDIVTGTRYAPSGGVFGWDVKRKLTSRGANLLAHILLQPGVSDLTGSFRLYRRDAFAGIVKQVTSKGYAFQMEIIVRAKSAGLTIEEVPIVFVDRVFGTSKLGQAEIVGFLKGLVTLFVTH